jgi:hypothetical protein
MKWVSLLMVPAVLWPSVVFAGSVSGGGGDTLPAQPIGEARILGFLKDSRKSLYLYFQYLNSDFEGVSADVYHRLFEGSPTIYDVIDKTEIEGRLSTACRDHDGNEMDGSIVAGNGGVCMSIQRLGAKLDLTNGYSQTTALLAHELSHKLGFNEDEADALQQDMLRRFGEWSVTDSLVRDLVRKSIESSISASVETWNFMTFAEGGNWDVLCLLARAVDDDYADYADTRPYGGVPLSVMPPGGYLDLGYFGHMSWALEIAACGQASPSAKRPLDESEYARYLTAFGERTEITFGDFAVGVGGWPAGEGSRLMMRRIDSAAVAKSEAQKLYDYLVKMRVRDEGLERETHVDLVP